MTDLLFQKLLNESDNAWDVINSEEDISVLSYMLWTWIEHLQVRFDVLPAREIHECTFGDRFAHSNGKIRLLHLDFTTMHLLMVRTKGTRFLYQNQK